MRSTGSRRNAKHAKTSSLPPTWSESEAGARAARAHVSATKAAASQSKECRRGEEARRNALASDCRQPAPLPSRCGCSLVVGSGIECFQQKSFSTSRFVEIPKWSDKCDQAGARPPGKFTPSGQRSNGTTWESEETQVSKALPLQGSAQTARPGKVKKPKSVRHCPFRAALKRHDLGK